MYKIYLKQALAMLKENKLLALISILGTALAICLIMEMCIRDRYRSCSEEFRTSETLPSDVDGY